MSTAPALPFVTVAIGTYNRSRWLWETLEFLTRQAYPADRWELLIVDNNSTDDTCAVVGSFDKAPKAPRYFFEVKQGSSHARNRAIAEAAGEILVFLDDDMLGGLDWIDLIIEPFLRPDAGNIGAVGGEVIPCFPEGLPRWLEGHWEPFNYRTDVGPLKSNQLPMTANLALRMSVLKEIGGFRTDLGRFGNRLTGSEDHELVRRVRAAGYEIWLSPPAGLRHQIPASRLTFKYTFRLSFDSARSRVIERSSHRHTGLLWLLTRIPAYLFRLTLTLVLSLFFLLTFQIGQAKRWACRAGRAAGYLVEIVCVLKRVLTGWRNHAEPST